MFYINEFNIFGVQYVLSVFTCRFLYVNKIFLRLICVCLNCLFVAMFRDYTLLFVRVFA